LTIGQSEKQIFAQAAKVAEVDILSGAVLPQLCLTRTGLHSCNFPFNLIAVKEHAEAFFKLQVIYAVDVS
jgi:hypothetical protein